MIRRRKSLLLIATSVVLVPAAGHTAGPNDLLPLNERILVAAPPSAEVDGVASWRPPPARRLPVRYGEQGGFRRLGFDWNRVVHYEVRRDGDRATIRFDRSAVVDLSAIEQQAPGFLDGVTVRPSSDGVAIAVTLPPRARLRHFRDGLKVVLDILPPAAESAARVAAVEPSAGRSAKAAPEPPPVKPTARAQPPVEAPKPVPGPRAAATRQHRALPEVTAAREEQRLILRFAWPDEIAAAAFRRAGFVWLVFDRPADLDLGPVRRAGGDLIGGVELTPSRAGTVVRLAVAAGVNPRLRPDPDGRAWSVELARQPLAPAHRIPVSIERGEVGGASVPRLVLTVDGAGEALQLRDPEVGDMLLVVPVRAAGAGIDGVRSYVQLRLLKSAQGVVIEPRADGLAVAGRPDGIALAGNDGLILSGDDTVVPPAVVRVNIAPDADAPRPPAASSEIAPATATSTRPLGDNWYEYLAGRPPGEPVFDFVAWRGDRPFIELKLRLKQAVADAAPSERGDAQAALARLYLGYGLASDALRVLNALHNEHPRVEARPRVRALRGAALYFVGKEDEAAELFADPMFDGSPEVAFWRAAFAGARGDGATAVRLLRRAGFLPEEYPPKLRFELELRAAEGAIAAGDTTLAEAVLDDLLKLDLSPEQRVEIRLLRGKVLLLAGDSDGALALWKEVAAAPVPRTAARAQLALVDELLQQQLIDKHQAIVRLDKLRYAWRGDEIEFNLLRRLGTLYLEADNYEMGLATLRQAATYFPDREESRAVTRQMTEVFAGLFGAAAADGLSPLRALALYDQFRELTPAGHDGDVMAQMLAERLIQVDLLDRAADLLEHQVQYRLDGADKARVGLRLAQVRLSDLKPQGALNALESSAVAVLPEDLGKRRARVEARALIELGRGEEAIALLAADNSATADVIRADLYWRNENWRMVVQVMTALIERAAAADNEAEQEPPALDDETAGWLLNLAVATVLDGDRAGLAKLREGYGAAMRERPEGAAFALIVDSEELPDDPRALVAASDGVDRFRAFMARN
jgi:predicted negative regulator of RcsB-dependent stress response